MANGKCIHFVHCATSTTLTLTVIITFTIVITTMLVVSHV
jgi:hypothetical protein